MAPRTLLESQILETRRIVAHYEREVQRAEQQLEEAKAHERKLVRRLQSVDLDLGDPG